MASMNTMTSSRRPMAASPFFYGVLVFDFEREGPDATPAFARKSTGREFLHAASACRLARVHVSFGVDSQIVQRRGELSGAGTGLAERSDDLHLAATKNPHLLIPAVGDVHELLIWREVQVCHRAAGTRVARDEHFLLIAAVFAKDLEPVVAPIADTLEAVAIDSEAVHRIAELSRRGTDRIGARRRG